MVERKNSRTLSRKAVKRPTKVKNAAPIGSVKDLVDPQIKRVKLSPNSIHTADMSNDGTSASSPNLKGVPKVIISFYNHSRTLCPSDPCSAFNDLKSARLVGLFELVNGDLSALSEDELLLHYRHATDLPEMQTIVLCEIGRYCLWRDIPNDENCLIVYASDDNRFPNIELVGNRVEHAILHLAEKSKQAAEPFLPKPVDLAAIKQEMRSACMERNKKKLGKAPCGAGLWVEVVNEVGYRPLLDSAANIRKSLEIICTTNDNAMRQAKMAWLMELATFAQIATDECDFGQGLELGQWLFLANHESLDRLAHRLLSTAYSMLRREEYKKILDLQMAAGIRRRKELDAQKHH